jgi:hypothetical protein
MTADEVVGANVLSHPLSGVAENQVSGEMAEGVVDFLEVIDVGQDDGKRGALTASPVQLALENVEDRGTVPQVSQRIAGGLTVQGFAGCQQFDFSVSSSLVR